jgi:hypothetical protein
MYVHAATGSARLVTIIAMYTMTSVMAFIDKRFLRYAASPPPSGYTDSPSACFVSAPGWEGLWVQFFFIQQPTESSAAIHALKCTALHTQEKLR